MSDHEAAYLSRPKLAPELSALQSKAVVLLVGGLESAASTAARELEQRGYSACLAGSIGEALSSIDASPPTVVVIDLEMPGGHGLALCQRLKRDSATRLIPVILLSHQQSRQRRLDTIESGADAVVNDPIDPDELIAQVHACVRTSAYTSDLDSAASIIMTLTAMLESRECSPGHCYRMANYAVALGRALRLSDVERQTLYRGAFLHDIGMLAIPDAVLRKGGRLEPEEYEAIKAHPVVGDALCANLRTLHPVRPIVRHHHERLDGSGYPDRLRGDAVPLLAQIVSIVDVYEAVTMGRAYVEARPSHEALQVLQQEVDKGWRRHDLVQAFMRLVENDAFSSHRSSGASWMTGGATLHP